MKLSPLFVSFTSLILSNFYKAEKNVCVFPVSVLKKLGMVGRHYNFILF